MVLVQRIAKNTGIIISGNIIFKILSLIVTIYLARYLGTVGFGKYSFVFAYLAFFSIITDLGIQKILVREMAREPKRAPEIIGNTYIIRSILTILAVILAFIIINLMQYPADTTTYVYIGTITLLFISFSDFYRTIFEANLRMEYNVIARLSFKGLQAVLILWIIYIGGTLAQILIATVFAEAVNTLLNYIFSRKFVRPKFKIDLKLWKYIIKESLPLALSSIIWIIHFRTDVVMLSILTGDAQVGIYSAAFKLSEPLVLIPSALLVSLFPLMSVSFKDSRDRLIKMYRLSFKYILIIMLPIAVGVALRAEDAIMLIYESEFAGSITVLQILVWAFVLNSFNAVLSNLLVSIDQQRLHTLSLGLGALFNVGLNFFLITLMGYNGAAIATVITKIIIFGANLYFVLHFLRASPIERVFVKPLISVLIMGLFIYYFSGFTLLLLIPSAIAIYIILLIVLRTFSEEDIEILKKIINSIVHRNGGPK